MSSLRQSLIFHPLKKLFTGKMSRITNQFFCKHSEENPFVGLSVCVCVSLLPFLSIIWVVAYKWKHSIPQKQIIWNKSNIALESPVGTGGRGGDCFSVRDVLKRFTVATREEDPCCPQKANYCWEYSTAEAMSIHVIFSLHYRCN